ncbi:hypothetical protein H2248_010142 [Termitomyces sp. 'cryptogamus']|nr:hypothetical protein H2248_010142 [Termitomyces sp. 'cryptogamus']
MTSFQVLINSPVLFPALTSIIPARVLGIVSSLILASYFLYDINNVVRPRNAILRVEESLRNVIDLFYSIEYTCDAREVQDIRVFLNSLQLRMITFKEETILASSVWREFRLFLKGHSLAVRRYSKEIDAVRDKIELAQIHKEQVRLGTTDNRNRARYGFNGGQTVV